MTKAAWRGNDEARMRGGNFFIPASFIVRLPAFVISMNQITAIRLAALAGFLAVALGAFGAHGLKAVLEKNGTLAVWQTAALYHLVHAVVLLVVAQRAAVARVPFALFGAGIVIFSGSLYTLAVTNVKWLGAITPLGGLCLLAGWLALAWKPRE